MLIINGNVHTMDEKAYEKGYVRVKGMVIEDVGDMAECPSAEEGERILDVKGAWVMPGIIEAHCHIGIIEEKLGVMGDDCNEETNPVTPELRAIDAVNPMDPAFHDAIEAGITSVMVGPGSANVVGGSFAFVKTFGRSIDELSVKSPAAMKVAFGENPKVNYGQQDKSPATRMAAPEEAK